jgi:hypothetical protein
MSLFSFISKLGEGFQSITSSITQFFNTKVTDFFSRVDGWLQNIAGYGKQIDGIWGMISKLFKSPLDLLNPTKLLASLNPTALLGEFSNLRSAVERILNGVGGIGALDPAQQQNLLRASQASAWQMALTRFNS